MSHKVQIVVLCEDQQTFSFARQYLLSHGFKNHKIRRSLSPAAGGSAYSYVLRQFPHELQAMRKDSVARKLLAITDEDTKKRSIADFQQACQKTNVPFRTASEPVAILIPKRNVETWIHCLEIGSCVSEEEDYKSIVHQQKRKLIACKEYVKKLNDSCRTPNVSPTFWPPSLAAACPEVQRIL